VLVEEITACRLQSNKETEEHEQRDSGRIPEKLTRQIIP
jgi:hypothetical protein